jgi:DNA adenine methylase
MAARVRPPIKWHGGKHFLSEALHELLPRPCPFYCEPFFGSGALLFRRDPTGSSEVVNDVDGRLVNFYRVLRDERAFARFVRLAELTPFAEAAWHEAGGHLDDPDPIERAHAFFVRCRMSLAGRMDAFAAITRTRLRHGMSEQCSAYLSALAGLPAVHERLRRVCVLFRDAVDLIRDYDSPAMTYYVDPPYWPATRSSPSVSRVVRERSRSRDRAATDALLTGARAVSAADRLLAQVFAVLALRSGFHLHRRQWRRMRGPPMPPADPPTAARDQLEILQATGEPPLFPISVSDVPAADRAVLAAASRGDPAALARAQKYLTDPVYAARWGDPANAARAWLILQHSGNHPLAAAAASRQLERMAADLGWSKAGMLERLTITRVTHNWFAVSVLEARAAQMDPASRGRVMVERCQAQAERRFQQSVRTLAYLRRVAPTDLEARVRGAGERATGENPVAGRRAGPVPARSGGPGEGGRGPGAGAAGPPGPSSRAAAADRPSPHDPVVRPAAAGDRDG